MNIKQSILMSGIPSAGFTEVNGHDQKTTVINTVENGKIYDENTIFGLGSLTKVFTCIAILQLREKNLLCINQTITTYIKELKKDSRFTNITIKHLMTHTSGLPTLEAHNLARKKSVDLDEYSEFYELKVKTEGSYIYNKSQLINFFIKEKYLMLGKPGEIFNYSNEGYGLLGIIIENVSGEKYEDYIKNYILAPLEMYRTSFKVEDKNVVELYSKINQVNTLTPLWWDAPSMRSAGYLKSTPSDMNKFLLFLLGKHPKGKIVLSEKVVNELFVPYVKYGFKEWYGYGLRIVKDYYGEDIVEHSGGLKGVSTHLHLSLKNQYGSVLLTNISSAPVREILIEEYNRLFINGKLKEFEGRYFSSDGVEIELEFTQHKLLLNMNKQKIPLHHLKEDLYYYVIREKINTLKIMDYQKKYIFFANRILTRMENDL